MKRLWNLGRIEMYTCNQKTEKDSSDSTAFKSTTKTPTTRQCVEINIQLGMVSFHNVKLNQSHDFIYAACLVKRMQL